MNTTSSVQAISTSVRNAANPILLQQAVAAFGTNTPDLQAFLHKGATHCSAFKAKFPNTVVVQKKQASVIRAAWESVSFLFHALIAPLDEFPQEAPEFMEIFSAELDQGRTNLLQVNSNLDHLEGFLSSSNQKVSEELAQQIQSLREQKILLESCPPLATQGKEAMLVWSDSIEKQLKASNRLLEEVRAAATEKLSRQDPSEQDPIDLRNMVQTELPSSMTESIFAAFVADEIGHHAQILFPSLQQFTSILKPFAVQSKKPLFIQATSDVEAFESFLEPFRDQLTKYPFQRFVKAGVEYEEILAPAVTQFTNALETRLDELEKQLRTSVFVPLTTVQTDFSLEDLGKTALRYSLLRIEASGKNFSIRLYESAPLGKGPFTPYVLYRDITKDQLLEPKFIQGLLKRSSSISKAQELKDIIPLIQDHWTNSKNTCRVGLNQIECFLNRVSSTMQGTWETRSKDFLSSLGAMFSFFNNNEESFETFLTSHLGQRQQPQITPSFVGKQADNPWGIWEALLLDEHQPTLLWDLKLASLVALSHVPPKTDEETEILINLAKSGAVSLSRKLSEDTAMSKNKFLLAHSILEGVRERLAEKERDLHLSLLSKIQPVVTDPIFESPAKEVPMPTMELTTHEAPTVPSNMEILGDFRDWTPSVSNLHPLYSFVDDLEKSYQNDNFNGIISSTKSLFQTFNLARLGPSFWNKLESHEAERLFLSLEKVGKFYFKSYFDANVPKLPDAESTLLMMEIMILADRLMKKLPWEHRLHDFNMPLSDLAPYLSNRAMFFRFANPKLDERLQALQTYFQNDHSGNDYPILSTNMARIHQQHPILGPLFGDRFSTPRLILSGTNGLKDENGNTLPEASWIKGESNLERYLQLFIDEYDVKYTSLPWTFQIEKMKRMLTGEVHDVLPSTFYAALKMAYYTQYFFRGIFVKPSNFRKSPNSYDITYETISEFDPMPGMSTITDILGKFKGWILTAKLNGIDDSVLSENRDLLDGTSAAHQFTHLQRPVIDPIIQGIQNPHLKVIGNPMGDAYELPGYGGSFNSFAPGITEAGRNLHDLNVVMVQPTLQLKEYLTKQQYEQISSLRTEPAMQIANTLSFFRDNSNLLHIPDMQTYFIQLIFDQPLLLQELQDAGHGPELERQLAEFASEQYSLNSQMGKIEAAHFHLSLLSKFREYSRFARIKAPDAYQNFKLPDVFSNFPQVLENAIDLADDTSKGVLHGLAAQQYMSQDSVSLPDAQDFLRHVILFHQFPASGKTIDPLLEANIKSLLNRFAPDIVKLDLNPEFFDSLVRGAYPQLPEKAEFIRSEKNPLFFSVKDHPVSIDLSQGIILAPGIEGIPLPADGLNSPIYSSLYGNREFRCKAISNSVFEFKDMHGQVNRLIRKIDGEFVIHRKFRSRKEWYQYIPQEQLVPAIEEGKRSSKLKASQIFTEIFKKLTASLQLRHSPLPILPALPLIERHSHWYTETTPAEMLIVNNLGQVVYRAEIDSSLILKTPTSPKTLKTIHRVSSDGKDQLDLVDSTHPAFSWALQFEDPQQTLIWKNPKNKMPERIEFPRFGIEGLSFTREENAFKSDQFSGYVLKRVQRNPLGIHCPNFLLLQNKNGEEKLILARQKISPSQKSSLSSRLSFERNSQKLGSKVQFYGYDKARGAKEFLGQEIGANFYLATILGAQHQYKEAISLLRKFGQGSNPFSEEEKLMLSWIRDLNTITQDDSPQLTALRTLAEITSVRNQKAQTNTAKPQNPKDNPDNHKLSELSENYFAVASKLGMFRLHPEEEFFLLQQGKFAGNNNSELSQIRTYLTNDVDKAKAYMLALGNNKVYSNEQIQEILSKRSKTMPKTQTKQSQILEPILADPLEFVDVLASSSDASITESLQNLFTVEGITDIEKKGLEFYHQDSLAYLQKKDKSEYRLKDIQSFRAKRTELEQVHSFMQEALAQAELSILRRVAKPSEDSVDQARRASQAHGNGIAPLEMNDLLLLFMNKDLHTLQNINAELTSDDIEELDRLIDLYLDLSIQNSQRKRVIGKMVDVEQFSSLSQDDPTLKLALHSFVAEAHTKRHFDSSTHRFLKVFEYHNGFYYRKNQIEKLQHLGVQLEGDNANNLMESLVLEMMVGAGKTTYLLPTKGFWSADGIHLSMAIMPEALIGNMSREVERILGKTFAQKVRRFLFNRNTNLSKENLEDILKMLHSAIEKKDYLITTDKSIKSFINQYAKVFKEALEAKAKFFAQKHVKKASFNPNKLSASDTNALMQLPEVITAQLMTDILHVFTQKADVLCDEADLILDPRRELNFPDGEASALPENYLSLSLQVYKFLISPEVQQITNFEFYPGTKDTCTPNVYEKQVKPVLVDKFIDLLSQRDTNSRFKPLQDFYSSCSWNQQEMLKRYFLGTDTDHSAEAWIRSLPDDNIRQELGLIRGELNILLPLTLQKNYGERYGFHKENSIIADPFSGSNNPNIGSQFSDPFERINYTIQAYLKEPGMRRAVLEKLVHDLQGRAWKELSENVETVKKQPPGKPYITQAHKEFEKYFGQRKNLALFQQDLVERLMEVLKEEPQAKFDLIEKYVLPQIQIYKQNLKSTSQSIGFLFPKPRGFTGTLWNAGTYHDAFKALFDDGARGQVVTLVYTQAKDKVSTIKIKSPERLHKELIIDNPKYNHIKALIDSGGALKELDVEEVARQWLAHLVQSKSPIQGVVYFDKKTDQAYIWEKGESASIPLSKSSCPIDKRITIYDQKHTTGTDIKQAIDAVALVTVSKGMIIRDFIQAVGRMRQLASGQKVEIAVLEQDAVAIREQLKLDAKAELTIEDILRFLILNEVRRQGEDNLVATTHKLTGVLQQWFLEKVLQEDFSKVITSFNHPEFIEGLFFQKSEISPFNSYGQGTDLVDAKSEYTQKQESLISRLNLETICSQDDFLRSCAQTARSLISAVIEKAALPLQITGSSCSADMEEEQEVQQEQETEQEQEQQQEQQEEQEKSSGSRPWRHSPWFDLDKSSVLSAQLYEPLDSNPRKDRWGNPLRPTYAHFLKANKIMETPIFDDAFQLSHNFQLNDRVFQGSPVQPFGEFQKTIQNIMIIKDTTTQKFKLIAIEPYDAASFKAALQQTRGVNPIPKDPDLQKKKLSWWEYAADYFTYKNAWTCLDGKQPSGYWSSNPCDSDTPSNPSNKKSNKAHEVQVWIGDLQLNSAYESQTPISRTDLESEEVTRLLVQAKYFNGIVQYTKKERDVLKKWLKKAAGTTQKKEDEFIKRISSFNEQAKRDYEKSTLFQIFKEL